MDDQAEDSAFVLDFILRQNLAVLTTINHNGLPESSVTGFGQTNLLELIFGADVRSRKYQNLRTNPAVAVVIGWGPDNVTVQIEGEALELADNNSKFIAENYWTKHPEAEKYYINPGQRYFLVKPKWIRYTDLSKEPWKVIVLDY